ncbi:MAG: hypothetical protein ABIX01_16990 [Chitinophagaceae bacterium]
MKNVHLLLFPLFCISLAYAQPCEVKMPELVGTYDGGCKDGKADGFGIAAGKHSFQGLFKKGKPDGRGTYTWEDGHFYVGEWSNGTKDGEGEMHYKDSSGTDSVVTGTWKKDKLVPASDKGYIVYFQTSKITRLTISTSEASENSIIIEVKSNTGGSAGVMSNSITTIANVYDLQLLKGTYEQIIQPDRSGNKGITRILKPTFPFRGKIIMGGEQVEIEFTQKKNWMVQVFINE